MKFKKGQVVRIKQLFQRFDNNIPETPLRNEGLISEVITGDVPHPYFIYSQGWADDNTIEEISKEELKKIICSPQEDLEREKEEERNAKRPISRKKS